MSGYYCEHLLACTVYGVCFLVCVCVCKEWLEVKTFLTLYVVSLFSVSSLFLKWSDLIPKITGPVLF